MTSQHIELVRDSWARVAPMAEQAAAIFHENLFSPDSLLPAVEALGRRHVGYGVENRHYVTVGHALLTTLSEALGGDFTRAHRDAWVEAYGTLVELMRQAAAQAA